MTKLENLYVTHYTQHYVSKRQATGARAHAHTHTHAHTKASMWTRKCDNAMEWRDTQTGNLNGTYAEILLTTGPSEYPNLRNTLSLWLSHIRFTFNRVRQMALLSNGPDMNTGSSATRIQTQIGRRNVITSERHYWYRRYITAYVNIHTESSRVSQTKWPKGK